MQLELTHSHNFCHFLKAANRPQPNETTDYTDFTDYQRLEQIARNWN
jgi:hypothetical protein